MRLLSIALLTLVSALAFAGCANTHTPAELRYWCLERANRRATVPEGGVPADREAMVDRLYCACLESVETSDSEQCQ